MVAVPKKPLPLMVGKCIPAQPIATFPFTKCRFDFMNGRFGFTNGHFGLAGKIDPEHGGHHRAQALVFTKKLPRFLQKTKSHRNNYLCDAQQFICMALLSPNTSLSHVLVSKAWLGAVLVNTVLCAVAYLFFLEPVFQTNDDINMLMLASGMGNAPEATEHLMYTSVWIGMALKALYAWAPNVSWYALYLIFTLWFSLVLLLFIALKRQGLRGLMMYLGFFLVVAPWLLGALQFTVSATLLGISGTLVCASLRREDFDTPKEWRSVLLMAALAILLGGMIRFKAVEMGVILAGTVVGFRFLEQCLKERKFVFKHTFPYLPVVLGLALGFASQKFDAFYYERSPEWKGFSAYQPSRRVIIDYKVIRYENKQALAAAEWSENDLKLIREFFFYPDSGVYSLDRLNKALDISGRSKPLRLGEIPQHLNMIMAYLLSGLGMFTLLLIFLFWANGFVSRNGFWEMWLAGVVLVLLALAFGQFLKFPPRRVFDAMFLFVGALPLTRSTTTDDAFLPQFMRDLLKKYKLHSGVILLTAALFAFVWNARMLKSHALEKYEAFKKGAELLDQSHRVLYVDWLNAVNSPALPAFKEPDYWAKVDLYRIGIGQEARFMKQQWEKYGCKDFKDLLFRDNVVWLLNQEKADACFEALQRFAKEHYDVSISKQVIGESPYFVMIKTTVDG